MESEQEWQFITNEIQNKPGSQYGEWSIGLEKNSTTQKWTWINGKSLTIDKWYKRGINPDPNDTYGLIHKEYPPGFKGSLSTYRGGATSIENGFARKKQVMISTRKKKIICESNAVVMHSFFSINYSSPPPPTPLLPRSLSFLSQRTLSEGRL